jgi:NAD-dependent dihydropyrimidine dehydrogenase PreA subunit/phosphohistidine swiveling domain-containing protein
MKRKIISIDDTKCTGCGQCIPDCPEGALQLIEGKARLVSDLSCDGLGACIGTCPEGAITIIEREAVPYDEWRVMETIAKQGAPVIKAHLEHLAGHGQNEYYNEAIEYLIENNIGIPDHAGPKPRKPAPFGTQTARSDSPAVCHAGPHEPNPFAGCPGSAARSIPHDDPRTGPRQPASTGPSELRQWPVQLALVNPSDPYFDNADLLVSADCVPFAYSGFHAEFLKGRILIIFCPKLDADIDGYIEKLAAIFTGHTIRTITLLHMEVPCCNGVRYVVEKALAKAGVTIPVEEKTITIEGRLK